MVGGVLVVTQARVRSPETPRTSESLTTAGGDFLLVIVIPCRHGGRVTGCLTGLYFDISGMSLADPHISFAKSPVVEGFRTGSSSFFRSGKRKELVPPSEDDSATEYVYDKGGEDDEPNRSVEHGDT